MLRGHHASRAAAYPLASHAPDAARFDCPDGRLAISGQMPQELLEVSDSGDSHDLGDRDGERSLARAESSRLAARFRRGQLVRHAKLGIGRVMDVSNMGQDTRLVVEFSTGRKTLVLPYAPVEPLD